MLDTRTSCHRFDVVINGYSEDLDDLVKNQVLLSATTSAGAQTDILAFSHHSLFDYAEARWLRGDHKRLVSSRDR